MQLWQEAVAHLFMQSLCDDEFINELQNTKNPGKIRHPIRVDVDLDVTNMCSMWVE